MYRYKFNELKKWKNSSNRKPLIIRGARQVGKTWLMQEFGKKEYEKCAYINFDENTRMIELFSGDFDIERIIQGLKIESGVNIEPENTLIIFDEVQETPKALTALKYFYEKANQYHIVAAGSLLGVAMHEGASFPVGKVDFLDLYPLNFLEFLRALGEENIVELVEKNDIEMIKIFSDKLKNYLKQYLYIGGMPEVVETYVETKDFIEVRRKQEVLLESYEQDFSKHAPNAIVPRIRQLWNNIPTQLAKENKKIVAITASMKDGTGLKQFAKEFPDRFFDIGIAEQHALGLAAGMAKDGIIPVVPIYSSFYQRAYDQVIHDIAIQNLPVVMCVDRAGIVGQDRRNTSRRI